MSHTMKTLLVATSNQGKYREILEILDQGRDQSLVNFLSLADVGLKGDFSEDGRSFIENAFGKAKYYARKSGLPTLAEDSGIIVDALKNELGVKTRRWGKGDQASDEEWIEYFLEVMANVPDEKRVAAFVCVAAFIGVDGKEYIFEGVTKGVITQRLEAPIYPGLPLSSCFKPEGFDKVYSALALEEKNRVSHRGKAIRPVRDLLGEIS